jgi:hypothetical protein
MGRTPVGSGCPPQGNRRSGPDQIMTHGLGIATALYVAVSGEATPNRALGR